MTNVPHTPPPAGWFPDPYNPRQQRWWDGTGWTEHYQPVPVPQPAPQQAPAPWITTPVMAPQAPQARRAAGDFPAAYPSATRSAGGGNSLAASALALGIMAYFVVVASPLKWIAGLIAVAAVVFGILAIRRYRDVGVGKKRAVWGIVLGAIALPIALVVGQPEFGEGFQSGVNSSHFDMAALEANITAGIKEQTGVTVKSVECPTSPTIKEGASFECVARTDGTEVVLVSVRIQDNSGSVVWEVKR
jgi:hypothetical protein